MFISWFFNWPFVALIGLSLGSFMTVVVTRLPASLNSALPLYLSGRSSCPKCGHILEITEIIPLFSWLWQKGQCRHCWAHISPLYPLTELTCSLLFVFISTYYADVLSIIAAWCLTWYLLTLALIDYQTYLLPDLLTLSLLWLGLLVQLLQHKETSDYIIGAVAGYLILWGIYQGYRLISGKEGIGYGDFKLTAALGAWAGWQQLPLICLCAALLGLAWAIIRTDDKNSPLPFGSCLCASGWVVILFYGQ